LVGGSPCLVVLQTLGPFRTDVYVHWDHVTLRLHTGGFYFIKYVTSEGNWLHQILFRCLLRTPLWRGNATPCYN
jgi:hypothetical protein